MKPTPTEHARLGDDESLFSRDIDGHLVRLDKVTAESFDQDVTLVIDDRAIRVKRAVPAVNSRGLPRLDEMGRAVPRATTIYDAASYLVDAVPIVDDGGEPVRDEKGRVIHRPRGEAEPSHGGDPGPAGSAGTNPIPILCHQPHLEPVAVCRACVVEISRIKRGERRTERKLLPACQHRVEDAMEVRTIATSKRVESAVKTVVELLAADHPSPCAKQRREPGSCELEALADRLGLGPARFASRAPRGVDDSSLLIAVDHSACILCDRCVRGCNDVKDNQVIGRMLKGYRARIAFDLDAPMGTSSCVSCGECMLSCPTGALVFREVVDNRGFEGLDPPAEEVDFDGLLDSAHPEIRRAFEGVSRNFTAWIPNSVVRRRFAPDRLICRQGEYGSTAFFIEEGSAEIYIDRPEGRADDRPKRGLLARVFGVGAGGRGPTDDAQGRRFIPADATTVLRPDRPRATLEAGALFGEMACLNGYPRAATVRAGQRGCTVLEMRRNVLDIMRRSRPFREGLDRKVRKQVIEVVLSSVPILSGLPPALIEELGRSATYRRCEPGEVILRQGELAHGGAEYENEGLFLIRSGFIKVARAEPGGQVILNYRGPGNYIGEIGLLSSLVPDDFGDDGAALAADLGRIHRLTGQGRRVATCTAIDHAELVRIAPDAFRRILRDAPSKNRRAIVAEALGRVGETFPSAPGEAGFGPEDDPVRGALLREFLDQGLIEAQSLLVLDLHRCTRCDECTKACSDTHGGVTRLIREGLRFDRFLVASSCRSCHDPVCLIGCPVDAIHRRPGSNEIRIESTCIGCGKCSENCPYGNISMVPTHRGAGHSTAVARQATTCDQCRSLPGHAPNCVVACPHDAAHRMEGQELFRLVQAATDF